MTPQITLYTSKTSPYGHYVEIALREAKAEYTRYEVDLHDKPSWFVEKINPNGQIPAITYGGPPTAPDDPSPSSHKLTESLVILEFIADIFPDSGLLPNLTSNPTTTANPTTANPTTANPTPTDPTDDPTANPTANPISRASARFFINLITTKLSPAFSRALLHRGSPEDILNAIDELQPYMPGSAAAAADDDNADDKHKHKHKHNDHIKGPFILGNVFSNADAVAAATFLRMDGCLKRDLGSFPQGDGIKTYDILHTAERYARYRMYLSALVEREAVKATFYEELLFEPNNVQYVLSKRA